MKLQASLAPALTTAEGRGERRRPFPTDRANYKLTTPLMVWRCKSPLPTFSVAPAALVMFP